MSVTSTISSSSSKAHPVIRWAFSSIGKKTIVAVTGILLIAFLVVHLLGNLSIFFGQDAINTYAEKLHSLGALVWVARAGLLAIFGLHILFTVLLIIENRNAGGSKYLAGNRVPATIFVKSMKYTGIIVLAFVIFHLAHLTLGLVQPGAYALKDEFGRPDVYSMIVIGFQNLPISIFYIIALTLLAFHLSHGIASLFQTFGITNKSLRPVFEKGGLAISWVLWAGYVSIPVSVLLGIIKLPA